MVLACIALHTAVTDLIWAQVMYGRRYAVAQPVACFGALVKAVDTYLHHCGCSDTWMQSSQHCSHRPSNNPCLPRRSWRGLAPACYHAMRHPVALPAVDCRTVQLELMQGQGAVLHLAYRSLKHWHDWLSSDLQRRPATMAWLAHGAFLPYG